MYFLMLPDLVAMLIYKRISSVYLVRTHQACWKGMFSADFWPPIKLNNQILGSNRVRYGSRVKGHSPLGTYKGGQHIIY